MDQNKSFSSNLLRQKIAILFVVFLFAALAKAQDFQKEFEVSEGASLDITNFYGQVKVFAEETNAGKISLTISSPNSQLTEKDFTLTPTKNSLKIIVNKQTEKHRIDLVIHIPLRSKIKIKVDEGEVLVGGNVANATVTSETGTIYADVPLDALKYHFLWTESRPRFLSDVELEKVKEKSAGQFLLSGNIGAKTEAELKKLTETEAKKTEPNDEQISEVESPNPDDNKKKDKIKKPKDNGQVELFFTTRRGVVLLNINPNEVPSDLRERELTVAAKAIMQSGDFSLMDGIRKVSPRRFGDYAKTLPPRRRSPEILDGKTREISLDNQGEFRRVIANVTDAKSRAISDLQAKDFTIFEKGEQKEIVDVQPATAPFNLVLLLDVSGSVGERIDFIRKAARNFINTVSPNDKIAVITFREDVQVLSGFTTDKAKLSKSLDTFDAGGATALYDSIAFSLVDTLRPLHGERTAIVVLSDGDDNRSFVPFESLADSIQESGALIYPIYIPSGLIPANGTNEADKQVDALRSRFLSLTSRAESEAKHLAEVSGGVYYPVKQLDQLQKAYDDVVAQLRTAYSITYRSASNDVSTSKRASPHLRVKVNREGASVTLSSAVNVPQVEENKEHLKEGSEPDTNSEVKEITGDILKINYKTFLAEPLNEVALANFDINKSSPAFLLNDGKNKLAVSRWVSPKRTRSYPYERVYNTLTYSKRATVIPILKDEGANGERDFLQFDTLSMMSLLDVYVVLGYYNDATRDSADELTDQKFDNAYILKKINELNAFKGTALEWNLKQLKDISALLERAKTSYNEISKKTGVQLHDEKAVDNFAKKIAKNLEEFQTLSREKSQKAQKREFQTIQPHEALSTDTKGRVTMTDSRGGKYFFTCDETKIEGKTLYLIEDKHTVRAKMPNHSDIKDGLLKMMLYTSLQNVKVGGDKVDCKAILRLTSNKIEGGISSETDTKDLEKFFQTNKFTKKQKEFVAKLFEEARYNKLVIKIEHGETA